MDMLLSDWRTRVLLACSSLPVAVETVYLHRVGDADDVTLLYCLLSVTCCLLMALLPRVGAWAIVALWVARCVIPGTTPLSVLFCLLMAVTVMAYRDMRVALPAALIAQVATAARIPLYPWDSSTFTMLCATAAFLLLALWLGSAMDRQERREAEERERAALLRRMADRKLATQLHHSVANDLTTILLLARQLASDDKRTVELIERTAAESLTKVRTLIAGLDHPSDAAAGDTGTNNIIGTGDIFVTNSTIGTDDATAKVIPAGTIPRPVASGDTNTCRRRDDGLRRGPMPPVVPVPRLVTLTADDLRTVLSPYGERLRARGLDGSTVISGERSVTCTVERRDVLFDILREIVGNMMKYADPEAGYCIAVTLATGLVTLSESNGVRTRDDVTHDAATPHAMPVAINAADADAIADTASAPSAPPMSGGTGLDRCRRAAAELGGEYVASADDGTWTVLLRLPLT